MSTSGTKRLKEQRRREQQRDKDERRRQRRLAARASHVSGAQSDPDIEGIVPGPQPQPEEQ
jgi:hypothetical protein